MNSASSSGLSRTLRGHLVLDVACDDLHSVQVRVKLFRDAVEQAECASYQEQIHRNVTDAPTELHPDIHDICAITCLLSAKQHADELQQGGDIHLLIEMKPGLCKGLGQPTKIADC